MTLQELGQTIREKREAAGLSIDDVAARIKVSGRTLRAIEEGSTNGLPHAVYTKGFIRSFALTVGYNLEELNERLTILFPPEAFDDAKPEPGPINRSMPAPSGVAKKVAVLIFIVALLGALGMGGWYVASHYGDSLLELVKQPFSAVNTDDTETVAFSATQPQPAPGASTQPHVLAQQQISGAMPLLDTSQDGTPRVFPHESVISEIADQTTPALAGVDASASEGDQEQNAGFAQPKNTRGTGKNTFLIKTDKNAECWVQFEIDGKKDFLTIPAGTEFLIRYTKSLTVSTARPEKITAIHNGKDMGRLVGQRNKVLLLEFTAK